MELDRAVLQRILAWGEGLEKFKPSHGRNALTIVQGYVDGVDDEQGHPVQGLGGDREALFLFATALTWTFWIDELFDADKGGTSAPVDVGAVLRGIEGKDDAPAAQGFQRLRALFVAYEGDAEAYGLWLQTAADAVKAWEIEDLLSYGKLSLSYAEYLENGYNSTAVPFILATAALVHRLDMPSRLHEEAIRSLLRQLSISCRLHNDIFSVEKERREQSCANAVLVLERLLPAEQAERVARDDLQGYERMLRRDVDRLPPGDAFGVLGRVMPEAHRILYTDPRGDYAGAQQGRTAETVATPEG
ncbi:terpene synthase family protein [Chondromyces crocatus]|uniref:Terpene synthase n=1 Tax=Chondromyces crocatus TaxID=52 RepID=A0A0K1EPP1_CHOCO|nr:terpene synthase family protein [Chondromyces crocatus]AKT42789.1 uncharacterized protein CMC5_070160 [Chondromyces crocatus]